METTLPPARLRLDVASAMSRGRRETQEDALVADFAYGAECGLAVLADGMGGHAAGEVASRIVVTEVWSDLKLRSASPGGLGRDPRLALMAAADGANQCLAAHVLSNPSTEGMGATLVALAVSGAGLSWISVGDSPLYLWRDGKLGQLNEDHSMAPQIDWMVESGQMDAETGANHPDRNCLTSVLIGAEIERIDCPAQPFPLDVDDVIVLASDGLQYIGDDGIARVLAQTAGRSSAQIAEALLAEVEALGHPEQDNTTLIVLRPQAALGAAANDPQMPVGPAQRKALMPARGRLRGQGGIIRLLRRRRPQVRAGE